MRPVILLAEAIEDLEEARRFYDAQEVGVGDYCVGSLLSDITSLGLFHGIHRRQFDCHRLLKSGARKTPRKGGGGWSVRVLPSVLRISRLRIWAPLNC